MGLNLTRTHLASGRKKLNHRVNLQDSVPHQVDAGRVGLRLDTPVRVLPRGTARLGMEFRELFHGSDFQSGWWFGTWLLFSISYIDMGCHPSH